MKSNNFKRLFFVTIIALFSLTCQEKLEQNSDIQKMLAETNYETDIRLTLNSTDSLSASMNMGLVSFVYSAKTDNNQTSTKLVLSKGSEKAESDFILDENLEGYKFDIHNKVIEQANKLLSMFTAEEIQYIAGQYEIFGRKILASEDVLRTSLLAQSIYFHNAVLNVINRSLQNKEECNCTPDPAYFVGKGPFFCQEDLKINTQAVLAILQNMKSNKKSEIEKIAAYLRAHADEDKISIDRLYGLFETKNAFKARVANYNNYYKAVGVSGSAYVADEPDITVNDMPPDCPDGSGSDLGCCGNYSGCCWLSSGLCLAHDVVCLCCDHWYCLWDCEPETSC